MSACPPELWMFHQSHFNEKARWALDWKGVRHVRRAFLPGPHAPAIRKREGLDFVAQQAGPEGFLVGGGFSVADLAAAALLAPTVDPSHPDMRRPRPVPAAVQRWLDRWAGHPGAAWVLETYRRHRPGAAVAPDRG